MSIPCMQRSFAKKVSLCASNFILSYVLLDSWNKNCINMNRRKCLVIVIQLNSHLVILVLKLSIYSPRNRTLGKMDLSHDQHGHCYKYTCTKFSPPLSRLNARKRNCAGKGGGLLYVRASKQMISLNTLFFFFRRHHLPVKTKDMEFSYLVSGPSNSDDAVWVQGADAVIYQGTAVRTGGNNDVFPSRCFCELKSKGTYAQDSPDCPAQHSTSSCL